VGGGVEKLCIEKDSMVRGSEGERKEDRGGGFGEKWWYYREGGKAVIR